MKKFLKWTAIILGVIIVALAASPFLFKDKIREMIINAINKNVDATVNFEDVDISLLRSFPKASVSVKKLSVINKAPFEGDTLVYSDRINLKMSVKEDRKSTRLNSSHVRISYAVFCLKKKKIQIKQSPHSTSL